MTSLGVTGGFTAALLWTAFVVATASFVVLVRRVPPKLSALAVFVKVAIPTVYFAVFFDGTWVLGDDIKYTEGGFRLVNSGLSLYEALFTDTGLSLLIQLGGGQHVLYYWWNMLAMALFTRSYYAPVFLNGFATVIAGVFIVDILRLSGFSRNYRVWGGLFFLLHWDILVWSSFVNLKDTLVLLLTVLAFYGVLQIISARLRNPRLTAVGVGCLGLSFWAFWWLRFYVPFLIVIAVGAWALLNLQGWKKYGLVGVLSLPGSIVLSQGLTALEYVYPRFFIFGFARMLFTPKPWDIAPSYSFLVLPSALHWVAFIPAVIGGGKLYLRSHRARMFLIYLLVILGFYAVVPELQGPRHRYQVSFVFAWMQFHFLWLVSRRVEVRY